MFDWLLDGAQDLLNGFFDVIVDSAEWLLPIVGNGILKIFDFALSTASSWIG